MRKDLLAEQLDSSVQFLTHRLRIERDPAERGKLEKELAQATAQLSAAKLRSRVQ